MKPLGADYQQNVRRGIRGPLDRRLRESGQAKRRVFGSGVRRASVHAAELHRHARLGVHARARAGPLDAHDAVGSPPAVRVLGLHDFRRRSAVDAQRDAVLRPHAVAHDRSTREDCPPPARHRRHRRHLLPAVPVRRLRAAGASRWRSGASRSPRKRSAASISICSRRTTATR